MPIGKPDAFALAGLAARTTARRALSRVMARTTARPPLTLPAAAAPAADIVRPADRLRRKLNAGANFQNPPVRIEFFGSIGRDQEINLRTVKAELTRANGRPVRIILDSDGGEVEEAESIAEALRNHRGIVSVHVKRAYSAALFVVAAGDLRTASRGSRIMFHASVVVGEATRAEHRGLLDETNQRIAETLARACHLSVPEILNHMRSNAIITGQVALGIGLIERIEHVA